MKPIVKWSGGKKDEIKEFSNLIPETIDTYVEPFFGGGAVFFHLEPKKAVVSDVHKELVDFYNAIKNGQGKDIHEFLMNNPNTEEVYYNVRDKFEVNTPLDNAKRFYYLRKTCYRGMLRYNRKGKFNIPYGRYKTFNFDEVKNENYKTIFENTKILNDSFEKVFEMCDDPKNFIFLDPPYYLNENSNLYGKNGDMHENFNHEKLFQVLNKRKNWIMTYNDCDYIRDLYKNYEIREVKWSYGMNASKESSEIVIIG